MFTKQFVPYAWLALISIAVLVISGCTAGGNDGGGPTPPSNVEFTANPNSITVTWSHDGQNVTGFTILREEATTGLSTLLFNPVGEVGPDERSFEDTTAMPSTIYRYAVTADGEGGSSAQADAAQNPLVIRDTVAAWTSGAAELVLSAFLPPDFDEVELVRGTINADGQIDLTLPTTVPIEFLNEFASVDEVFIFAGCIDGITIEPTNAQGVSFPGVHVQQNDSSIGFLGQAEPLVDTPEVFSARRITRTYFDVAVRAVGTCTITEEATGHSTLAIMKV